MAEVVETGAGGNCLFSSIGRQLEIPADKLRRRVARYARKNPDAQLMQETVRHWVVSSEYCCVKCYADHIKKDGVHGSALEIAIISKKYNRRIVVWTRVENTLKAYQCIAEYEGEKPTIHLLYGSNHYQVLLFD